MRVSLPKHQTPAEDLKTWRTEATVFEFTQDARAMTILCKVLHWRERYKQFEPRRILYSAERMSRSSLAALAQKAADDPWLIEYQTDPLDGDLLRLELGKNVTSNPLFVHFFRNLTHTQELDPEQVVQSLQTYLGRPQNENEALT